MQHTHSAMWHVPLMQCNTQAMLYTYLWCNIHSVIHVPPSDAVQFTVTIDAFHWSAAVPSPLPPPSSSSRAGKDKSGDKLLQRRDWFRCTKNTHIKNTTKVDEVFRDVWKCTRIGANWVVDHILHFSDYTGCLFHWYPPKKLKYGKPRLGESTLT